MIIDFPIVPPMKVKDEPLPRDLKTLKEARSYVEHELTIGRPAPWRDLHARLKSPQTEEDAIEAIGALRELLALEGLLVSSDSSVG
jgi:hypothetical protein